MVSSFPRMEEHQSTAMVDCLSYGGQKSGRRKRNARTVRPHGHRLLSIVCLLLLTDGTSGIRRLQGGPFWWEDLVDPEKNVSPAPTPLRQQATFPPTPVPTLEPSPFPTMPPTPQPTPFPTSFQTFLATPAPVTPSTFPPTPFPTLPPTIEPSSSPTRISTEQPTTFPTRIPTARPTAFPTLRGTSYPTTLPTSIVTPSPAVEPMSSQEVVATTREPQVEDMTELPTGTPVVDDMTESPTRNPQVGATESPVAIVTSNPTPPPVIEVTLPPVPSSPTTVVTSPPVSDRSDGTTIAPQANSTGAPTVEAGFGLTSSPTHPITPTAAPTFGAIPGQRAIPFEVPINFQAELKPPPDANVNELLSLMASEWRSYIRTAITNKYGESVVQAVLLALRQRSRRLQASDDEETLDLVATGQVDVEFEGGDEQELKDDVSSFMQVVLNKNNLQAALNRGSTGVVLSGVQGRDFAAADVDGPTLVEMIIGFTLLGLAVLSLCFWARVLYRKRQKRIRKRQLAASRKLPPAVPPMQQSQQQYQGPSHRQRNLITPTRQPMRPAQPRMKQPVVGPPTIPEKAVNSADSSDESSYKGILSDDSTASSAFGKELRQAASEDMLAWEDFQKRKEMVDAETRSNVTTSDPGVAHIDNVALYNASLLHEQGVEVQTDRGIHPLSNLPYGDDGDRRAQKAPRNVPSRTQQLGMHRDTRKSPYEDEEAPSHGPPRGGSREIPSQTFQLDLSDDVGLDARGVSNLLADRYGTQDDGLDFTPYGDNQPLDARQSISPPARQLHTNNPPQKDRKLSLRESWDAEDEEHVSRGSPSKFSFVYPLKRQDISDQAVPSVNDSSEDPSNNAVRASPTVSSWSYVEGGENQPYASSNASVDSQEQVAKEMMEEVARISRLVKRYDERKRERSLSQERNKAKRTAATTSQRSSEVVYERERPYRERDNAYADAEAASNPNAGYPLPDRAELPASFESAISPIDPSSYQEEEDDDSLRLGIGRFTMKQPPEPLLGFNNANVHNMMSQSPASVLTDERENRRAVSEAQEQEAAKHLAQEASQRVRPPAEKRSSPRSSPKPRVKDQTFNRLFSMFESKPKTAVTPPNETWQYNG